MKAKVILTGSLAFVMFLSGFIIGRNQDSDPVHIETQHNENFKRGSFNAKFNSREEAGQALVQLKTEINEPQQQKKDYQNNEPAQLPPHEKQPSLEETLARAEQIKEEKGNNIEVLLELIDSMKKNKFPQEQIDSINEQLNQIASSDSIDESTEQNPNPHFYTIEEQRAELAKSLEQNMDISSEDRDAMLNAMFPLETSDEQTVPDTESTSITPELPH